MIRARSQIVPIAPQLNVQNVNVATHGEVEQGDANNANTGQANQQENSSKGASSGSWQRNDSDQKQIQIVPIAPQKNLQNVNVLTGGDVEQGDANNANTGQASQQENTSKGGHGSPAPASTCGYCSTPTSGGGQKNDSDQHQIQIVPIAPQANLQNVNVLTFGDVEQGNANNANTGQANQQSNSSGSGAYQPQPCYSNCGPPNSQPKPCEPKPEPKPCPKPEPKPCEPRSEPKPCPKPEPKPCEPRSEPKPCEPKPEPKPCEPKPEPKPCDYKQGPKKGKGKSYSPKGQHNSSSQKQIQIVPIAPQLNVQNVNVLTFGDVKQGNANNANTGQANQQQNTLKPAPHKPSEQPPVFMT